MNYKNLFFLIFVCVVFVACKTTQELSNEVSIKESRIPSMNIRNRFSIKWYLRNIISEGIDCNPLFNGICIDLPNELMEDQPICIIKTENSILSIAAPHYNNEHTINPQFEMFNELDVLSITDSLIIWDEEILEQLGFATPIAIVPNNYPINTNHDTICINLHTCPVRLEKKVCVFCNYDDGVITDARFQDYYDGFLGASDILTGIINGVGDEYLTITFLFDFNVSDAQYIINHIINNHIFRIIGNISCNENSIYNLLGFSEPFTLLYGDYESETVDGGFQVKVAFIH